ncbi:MAG: M1 family aminopeptidase [Solirubrobacteraceae bacterium]|nr:M1 family aminopeptidase [Solirubrobacteraceae bacterium]
MSIGRRLLALLAALVALTAAAAPASAAGRVETPYRDAVSYAADLTTVGDGRTWTGTEKIVVKNAGRKPLDRVWLRLWGNGPVGCSPRAVTVTAVEGGTKRRLTRRCSALEILLPAPLAPGLTTTLTLSLSITAPDIQDRFGSAEGIFLFGNALPVVAQRDVRGWQLPGYSQYGESFVSSWAAFDLAFHHPVSIPVAASGTTTTTPDPGGATATTTTAIQARDAFWATGPMTEVTGQTKRGTLVRAWSTPEAVADRKEVLAQAVGALEEIERHLPDYPYPEFDVVVARIEAGGGMEYPGIVLTDGSDDVTRHETGHQWFYGLVGDDQYREPWVDEGLTSFIEYTWSSPSEKPLPRCYPASKIALGGPSTFATNSMEYWNTHVGQYIVAYNNPVCALRDLRKLIGRGKFGRVMHDLVESYATGFLSSTALRRAFREAGGRRTDAVWRRWGLAPGR